MERQQGWQRGQGFGTGGSKDGVVERGEDGVEGAGCAGDGILSRV